MTQEELALKVGTTKNYISRIENNASDIRLSTLMRIIRDGLDFFFSVFILHWISACTGVLFSGRLALANGLIRQPV